MSSMPLMTLFLEPNPPGSPHVLTLPEHWHLHRVVLSLSRPSAQGNTGSGSVTAQPSTWPKPPVMWSQPRSGELLQNALNTDLTLKHTPATQSSPPQPSLPSDFQYPVPFNPPPTPPSQPITTLPPSPHKHVTRRPRRRDHILTRASSAPPAFQAQRVLRRPASFKELRYGHNVDAMARAKSHPEVPKSDFAPAPLFVPSSFGIPSAIPKESSSSPGRIFRSLSETQAQNHSGDFTESKTPSTMGPMMNSKHAVQRLGNFFLTSCPGKKVRLQGPVRGRGTICRDIRADLARVKELGVKCIVW